MLRKPYRIPASSLAEVKLQWGRSGMLRKPFCFLFQASI